MHGVLGATRNRTEARGAPFTLYPILPQRASIRAGSTRCSTIFFAGETVRASLLRQAAFCTRNERAPPIPRQARICSKLAFRARSKHKLAANRPPHPQQTSTRGKPPSVPAISRYFQKSALCNIGSVLKSRNVAFLAQNRLWMTRDCHSKRFEHSRAVTKRPFFGNIGD